MPRLKKNRAWCALLADPDPITRQVCHETLAAAGFTVINSLDSGAGAVTMARTQQPDVILLGQQLSDVPALEAVKWLRSNSGLRTTPIIILGGKPQREDDHTAGDAVIALPRPITASRIRQILVEALPEHGTAKP